jgi:uncharacterized protein (DUF1499 family)
MIARPSQRLARSAPWALRLAALPVPLVILAAWLHRFAAIDTAPLFVTLALAWTLAAASLVLAGLAFRSIWIHGDSGMRPALLAAMISVVVLALPAAVVAQMIRLPRIADISTDGVDPPLFTVAPETVTMRPVPDSGARAAQQAAYPDILPRHYPVSPERAFEAIDAIAAQEGWRVTDRRAPDADNAVGWIEAEGATTFFGLPVDVVIRVVEDDGGTLVDVRSASRIGKHDLGDNAGRIRGFFAELDVALQGVTEPESGTDDSDVDASAPSELPPLPVPPPVNGR